MNPSEPFDILPLIIADVRPEIAGAFESDIRSLQFSGDGYKSGQVYPMHGIVYIPDPYETRRGK